MVKNTSVKQPDYDYCPVIRRQPLFTSLSTPDFPVGGQESRGQVLVGRCCWKLLLSFTCEPVIEQKKYVEYTGFISKNKLIAMAQMAKSDKKF